MTPEERVEDLRPWVADAEQFSVSLLSAQVIDPKANGWLWKVYVYRGGRFLPCVEGKELTRTLAAEKASVALRRLVWGGEP